MTYEQNHNAMAKKETNLGYIEVSKLAHRLIKDPKTGKKGIFIPVDDNPCLYVVEKETVENGVSRTEKSIRINAEIVPILNSQFGSNFMIKAKPSKDNYEKMRGKSDEEWDKASPVLGYTKHYDAVPDRKEQEEQEPEDLPEEFLETEEW